MAALPHTKWDEGQRRARKKEQELLIPNYCPRLLGRHLEMGNGQSRAARYSVALAQQRWQTVTRSAVTSAFFLDNFVRHGKIPHRALLRPWVDM
ncbi:hypothetical protein HBI38_123400 [Parastagonospora nodorum]|nr:hypothetical protein HBI73_197750 [Parastagonospora nodorum]KAH6257709.1 hypothetical protein HBI41_156850 [Parastagonospora nodorum]KAH6280962.1 hypothetical protein HBI40_168240 [Parastagonospora nodorum]KAH6318749.1 hypothetical protein HBI38_123400 [Parastagonospora nodorum]